MTHIWVPKFKILEPKEFIPKPLAIAGFFKMEAVRPDGRRRLLADWFPNLVTTQGLDFIGAGSNFLAACRVGTGNTTPANGDTNLVSHVAGTSTVQASASSAQGSSPFFGFAQKTFRFAQGTATGNLAEVGIGTAAANASNLFSRALILDGDGDPTTLTVLSDEFLDVAYELRCYPNEVDGSGSFTITGVGSRNYTARASNANSAIWSPGISGFIGGGAGTSAIILYSGVLGSITSTPATSITSTSSSQVGSYSNGNLFRDFSGSFDLNSGNGSIRSLRAAMGCGAMQYELDSAFTKTNTQLLSLVFRHTWARKTL